ncbi:MAG: aminotransferase class I/II-fold pyridoxal phosphate-dependent enzyme, partial [Pseudomonadota bacterium]
MSEKTAFKLPDVTAAEPIPPSAMSEVNRILGNGDLYRYTTVESPVTQLEREFATKIGSRYALAVSSCSAALFLSLMALDLQPGAKVMIPAFTFVAVPSAVVHADCVPVLCECGSNYRIDLDDFRRKLPEVDAVLISHMRGHTSDMDAIMAACDAAGVPVVEDAAHSLGTTWDGRKIGTLGKIGCYSFQSYKLLNSGEGGIMVTDDPELMARAIMMHGSYEDKWQHHDIPADVMARVQNNMPMFGLRLNTLSAVLIRAQLEHLDQRVLDGRRNHDHVAKRLQALNSVKVPAAYAAELRAPDSLQFNLPHLSDDEVDAFVSDAKRRGLHIQVFGRSKNNSRAYWNWGFLNDVPDLPQT